MTLTSVNIVITLTNKLKSWIVIIMLLKKKLTDMFSIKVIFNTEPSFLHRSVWWRRDNAHLFYGAPVHMPNNLFWFWWKPCQKLWQFLFLKNYMLQVMFVACYFCSLMRRKVIHYQSFLIYVLVEKERID